MQVLRRYLLLLAVAASPGQSAAQMPMTVDLYTTPECPAVGEAITLQGRGGGVGLPNPMPLAVEVGEKGVRVVAENYGSYFPELTGTLMVKIPGLSAGTYSFELYTRARLDQSTLGPEVLSGRSSFTVYETPPVCGPEKLVVTGRPHLVATAGAAFEDPIRVRVTDAHDNPLAGVQVTFARVPSPTDLTLVVPNLAPALAAAVTDGAGVASVNVVANSVVGAYSYLAYFATQKVLPRTYLTLYNAPQPSLRPNYPVVEYVRTMPQGNRHYFMTGDHAEMVKLDQMPEWQRTGAVHMAFAPFAIGGADVCRYYGLPSAELDSHFFSASSEECAAVAAKFPDAWRLETPRAFSAYLPNVSTGECPAYTSPLYRAFNNLPDANHRYAATAEIALAGGWSTGVRAWTLEGYGPAPVAMCLPR